MLRAAARAARSTCLSDVDIEPSMLAILVLASPFDWRSMFRTDLDSHIENWMFVGQSSANRKAQ